MVKTGKPYVMFGDGRLASCKPISERDLAAFIADCVQHADKANTVLPIGGARPSCNDMQSLKEIEIRRETDICLRCQASHNAHQQCILSHTADHHPSYLAT